MIAGVPASQVILSPFVIIIIIVSIVSIGTILDRIVYFSKLKFALPDFLKKVKMHIERKEFQKAEEFCDSLSHPVAKFAREVLGAVNLPRAQVVAVIHRAEATQIKAVQSHVGVLTVVSFIGPLLGLFGTVVGIVQAFSVLAESGGGSATEMMGGIGIALVTTAVGIAVAVPAAIAYGVFAGKVDVFVREMRMVGKSITRTLSERKLIDTSVTQRLRKKEDKSVRSDPSENSEALMPGINMALLIICFFMIFIPNMYQSNFSVSTPALKKSKQEKKQDKKDETELKLTIFLAADGSMYINNELMPPDTGVQNELMRQLLLRSLNRLAIISADEGLYHWQVVDVMDRATVSGAEKVCLLKRRS
jgi:biopolymer transport protein ExbB